MTARIVDIEQAKQEGLLKGASCAFGVFDGFHLGHRFLIDRALETAGESDTVALTFDIDPDEIFRKGELHKLMTNEERIATLADSGVETVVVLPFTSEFASQEPDDFLEEVFGLATPSCIHVGSDFRFGAKASGNVDSMREWGSCHDMDVCAHELLSIDGAPVSATRIRKLIDSGDTQEASKLLGGKGSI